jgi:hypothetical protein
MTETPASTPRDPQKRRSLLLAAGSGVGGDVAGALLAVLISGAATQQQGRTQAGG